MLAHKNRGIHISLRRWRKDTLWRWRKNQPLRVIAIASNIALYCVKLFSLPLTTMLISCLK